jgi:hypothetical protein
MHFFCQSNKKQMSQPYAKPNWKLSKVFQKFDLDKKVPALLSRIFKK